MKPDCEVARRSDYSIARIAHADGARFICQYHYAGGCSKTGLMFGMARGDLLVGVAQYLPPTKVAAQSVHPDWKRVLSLTRLAVLPEEPQNAASILIGASVRLLRQSRRWAALVTYADESQGHTGTIYKATNWVAHGVSSKHPRWVDKFGRQVATKCGPRTRTKQEMLDLGYTNTGTFAKLKFTMLLEKSNE